VGAIDSADVSSLNLFTGRGAPVAAAVPLASATSAHVRSSASGWDPST
jgi:hypothetical protein